MIEINGKRHTARRELLVWESPRRVSLVRNVGMTWRRVSGGGYEMIKSIPDQLIEWCLTC